MSRARRSEAGFSLLEMLVGLTLLGLISVAVTQSVRTGLRMWQAAEANDEAAEWQQTAQLVEHWMSRALPPRAFDLDSRVIFDSGPAGVRFLVDGQVGRKPAGYSRIALQAVSNPVCPGGADLVLTWEDVAKASNFAVAASDSRVLAACADAVEFDFGDGPPLPQGLEEPEYIVGAELPRSIRIRVVREDREQVLAARLLYAR